MPTMSLEMLPLRAIKAQPIEGCGTSRPGDALVLSGQPEIDLHLAIDLVKRGCPPPMAVRILL